MDNSTATLIQMIALEWMRSDSTWSTKVDWTKQTGVAGYSMGGIATTETAAN